LKALLPALFALLTVLMLSGGLAFTNLRSVRASAEGVTRTHEVLDGIQICLTTMVDAETGQRGYLITRDRRYLEPYLVARAKVTADLQRLEALVRLETDQTRRFQAVERLAAAKLAELEQTLALAERDPVASRQLVLSHLGMNLMDDLRAQVAAMTRTEEALLARRSLQAARSYRIAVLSGAFLALTALLLAGAFLLQARRYLAQRQLHDQALEHQRQWLQVTLRSIGDAVIATDATGAVTFMNLEAERLTGWAAEEAQGQALTSVFSIINEETGATAPNPAEGVLREGVVVGLATPTALLRKDGRRFPIEESAAPIRTAGEGIIGVVLVFHDVTDQRAAAQALRASEARYRAFVDSVPAMLFTTDAQGRPTEHNLRWRQYTGLTSEQGQGEAWKALIHPGDRQRVSAAWSQSLRTGANYEVEYRIQHGADLAYRWHSVRATLARDEQGHPTGWFGLLVDIEDRKHAEERVRESEARFRGLANAIPQLCWMADADGYITWYNQRWYEYVGTTPEQMEGWGWESVHDPAVLPQVLEQWQHSLATGSPFEMVFPLRGGDGVFRPFLTRVMPVSDGTGKVTRWFGTNTDITEREQAKEVLREEGHRKDAFLAVLGHELRNPLAPIRQAVHLLGRQDQDPATLAAHCAIIERQVSHLVRLVDDLLDVSRIARGQIQLRKAPLDLVQLLRGVVEDYQPVLADKAQALETDLPEGPIPIEADATRIVQAISNLLHNASKFTDVGGRIRLRAGTLAPGRAWVRVEDPGAGIAPELLPHLFDPFMRDKDSVGRSREGLGLGLALAQGLVGLHGGTLSAHSDGLGRGAVFTLELPLAAAAQAPEPEPPAAATGPGPSRTHRILVVEDLIDTAVTLKMVLELYGHTVTLAHDGRTGLHQAASFGPDLVLCDIGLPGDLDGYGVAQALRSTPGGQGLHLVAMTGFGTEEDRARALAAGFDAHLTKPVAPEAILALIAQLPAPV
jgi:PAS domain S-box-containing protein